MRREKHVDARGATLADQLVQAELRLLGDLIILFEEDLKLVDQQKNTRKDAKTDWLLVAHIDEVMSVVPDGKRVVVADSESGYALLLLAKQFKTATGANGEDAAMLGNMTKYRAIGGKYAAGGTDVKTVLGEPNLRDYNLDTVVTKMDPAQFVDKRPKSVELHRIHEALGCTSRWGGRGR